MANREIRKPTSGARGIRRLRAATRYSVAGLTSAWRSEEAFRIESVLALILLPLSFWVGHGAVERALLIGSVCLVLIVELLNTSIEYTVDRIGPERHHLSGGAKDLASAAVMISLFFAAIVWGMIAWERFMV